MEAEQHHAGRRQEGRHQLRLPAHAEELHRVGGNGEWSKYRGLQYKNRSSPKTGTNCIKIGLPGKLILRKRKGPQEVLFS